MWELVGWRGRGMIAEGLFKSTWALESWFLSYAY